MSKIVKYDLLKSLEGRENLDKIDDEIYICELSKSKHIAYNHPIKTDLTICCICLQGEMNGKIDLIDYHFQSSSIAISIPGQILEPASFSDDFYGILIYMTKDFTERLDSFIDHSLYLNIKNRPHIKLNEDELNSILNYCNTLRRIINVKDSPHQIKIITHLTLAYFYGIGNFIHKLNKNHTLRKGEKISSTFIKIVRDNYRTERKVDYYAKEMNITASYLSHIVKKSTGKTASQWIDDYVILEAKALLKSTNMTIQEISDELNFPSQSFFGKFFKRIEGIAPKFYR